jgi:hypothetical protein
MSVRLWLAVATAVAGAFVLAGCSSDSGSDGVPFGSSKTVICGKALGVIVLSEASDDAKRKAQHARDAADVLGKLATQTQDASLSSALRAAASQAGQVTQHQWSGARLKAWAAQEQARFSALRDACA